MHKKIRVPAPFFLLHLGRLTLQADVDYGLLTYKIYHFALMYFADLPFIYGNYVFFFANLP